MSEIKYYFDKGGVDKLARQYPQLFKSDPSISHWQRMIKRYEKDIVNRLQEILGESTDEND